MRNRVLALACVMLACRAAPGVVQPPPTSTTRYYRPLEMKHDLRRGDRAVILGSDERNGSTVLVLPTAPRAVVVDALFVSQGDARPASGGRMAVTLTVALETPPDPAAPNPPAPSLPAPSLPAPVPLAPAAPNLPAPVPLAPAAPTMSTTPGASNASPAPASRASTPAAPGVVGAEAPGNASWHAGLARARFVAAVALGKDPADLAIAATPAVPSEDAAASALIAAGALAALTGAPVDPAATLTGALNPDGTIGPVTGIPEQLLAAIAHGKTRIGFPGGMRIARSQVTGRDVDLIELAKARRAEAIELATVYDAYQLLTRKRLPPPVAVDEADMALEAETLDGLRTRYLDWQKRLASEWAPLLQLEQSGRLPAVLTRLVRLAHDRGQQAEALYRAGNLAAAYRRIVSAWVWAASANDTQGVLAKLHAGDVPGAAATLAALEAADASAGGIVARIGELRPATLAGHLAMMAALHTALRGASYRAFAAESLRSATQLLAGLHDRPRGAPTSSTTDAVASAVAPAAVLVRSAIAELTIAEQELALAPDRGASYAASPAEARRLAGAFHTAASAAMRQVDTLLVEPVARRASIPDDIARRRVASEVPGYLIADHLTRLLPGEYPQALGASWSADAPAASLVSLAGYQLAYHSAAVLAATHGSLAVHVDDAGRVDRVEPGEAVRHLLAAARHGARAAARAARIATGEIPVPARLAYQLAVDANEDAAAQLAALDALWTATAFSHAAVMLARQ